MSCIHTGAVVVVDEYTERVTCDIHLVGGCLILRITNDGVEVGISRPGPGEYFLRIHEGNWFDRADRRVVYSTLVAPLYGLRVPSEHLDRWPHLV